MKSPRRLEPSQREIALIANIEKAIVARPYANRITSRELEAAFGISGVKVRRIVEGLRDGGVLIGSDTGGYWGIRSEEELESTISHLESRAKEMLARAAALRAALRDGEQLRMFV